MQNKGLKLLGLSIIYRVLSFIYFSFTGELKHDFIKLFGITIGVIFLSGWFLYGYKQSLGLEKGFIIGLIGASDALYLQFIIFIGYTTRNFNDIGSQPLIPWFIPCVAINDLFPFSTDLLIFITPFLAIFLTTIGSHLGSIRRQQRVLDKLI